MKLSRSEVRLNEIFLLILNVSDFGMARDIYYHEYYKPQGRRLMPIRWLSPESVSGFFLQIIVSNLVERRKVYTEERCLVVWSCSVRDAHPRSTAICWLGKQSSL